jgi:hypothetical protein
MRKQYANATIGKYESEASVIRELREKRQMKEEGHASDRPRPERRVPGPRVEHHATISVKGWGHAKVELSCPCGWSTPESSARTSHQLMDRCEDHDKTFTAFDLAETV